MNMKRIKGGERERNEAQGSEGVCMTDVGMLGTRMR
jgi:hypothetical protein